jgi:ubiquilin
MGAPPSEDQIADMLSDPTLMATMQEYMNSPQFIDMMIQSNPMLANMPNAREMLSSPQFRRMMTDPESLRMAARMRSMMGGGSGANAFPAPGVTDNTPGGAPANNNNNPFGGNAAQGQPFNPFLGMGGLGGAPGNGGMAAGLPDFARIFGDGAAPGAAPAPASNPASPPAAGTDSNAQTGATGTAQQPGAAQANPFAALFGGAPGAQGTGAGAANQNPYAMPGMPPITPETLRAAMQLFASGGAGQVVPPQVPGMPPVTPEMVQQALQMFGGGQAGFGAPAAAPPDNRPPEEVYAEQLRQLNDMGFFDFDRNVQALRRSGGSVQGAIEHLLSGP